MNLKDRSKKFKAFCGANNADFSAHLKIAVIILLIA